MSRRPLTHDPVFSDSKFAETYLSKHRKLLARLGREYCAMLHKRGFRSGDVLDVGCGFGEINLVVAEQFPETTHTGIDLSKPLLEAAKQSAESRGVAERVHFAEVDAQDIPYEDDSFDLAFNINMLHIVNEPILMLNEIERVLKPGGLLYMLDLRRSWLGFFEKEIRSSYSVEEAREIIGKSNLREGNITTDMLFWKYVV